MFQHAGKSGAKTFDGVQVKSIQFEDAAAPADGSADNLNPGRPVSATYTDIETKATGEIAFDYVVDASGRVGVLSTKYMKNRRYNQGLKNVASWGYWKGTGAYAVGTPRANSPFFEALQGTESQLHDCVPNTNKSQTRAAGLGSFPCTTERHPLVLS
jgi:flavine halogenase